MKVELEGHIHRMLKQGLISPSDAPNSCPVVLVTKPNGKTRMCVDFRRLNKVIVDCPVPLPSIQEIFDNFTIAEDNSNPTFIMSSLDMHEGFHQLLLHPDSRKYCTFSCHLGSFFYNRVPMGLKVSPFFFLRTVYAALSKCPGDTWQHLLCYMDDICLWTNSVSSHFHHLKVLFQRLR